MTFSSPNLAQTLEAMVLTVWKGILKPGKKPTMHLFHFSAVSVRISWGILRRAPTFCLGIGSSEKRVLESVTLTLSAHETVGVAFFVVEDGGGAVFCWFACRFFAG